jgi:hypothetical protein
MYSFISSTQNDHQGNMNHMNPNRRFTQHNSSPDSPNTNDPKVLKQKNSNSFLMELVNASTSLGANTANLLNATGTNSALILPTLSTIASTLPTHSSSLYSHNNSLTAPILTLGANSTCSSMSISTTSPSSLSCLPKYRFVFQTSIFLDIYYLFVVSPCALRFFFRFSWKLLFFSSVCFQKSWSLWSTCVTIRSWHMGHIWLTGRRRRG